MATALGMGAGGGAFGALALLGLQALLAQAARLTSALVATPPGADSIDGMQIVEEGRATLRVRRLARSSALCKIGFMILLAFCVAVTVFSYYVGVRTPGRGNGTVKGWMTCIVLGVLLAASYFAFSAYGMLFSLDSLLAD